ncbi:hypothetical protein PLESTB_000589600 [Pleodorina starrii]|uniref:Uncharacterized protein n=1 Tax=Pleodorina starrii TaxID=330485 RepID=A0A9W6BHZ6_9CHLO|nr:hypothetical protein PLESTM_000762800 [Pleodorina starrii]GLC52160.1 hypothetical protein PLESTB_000589600 [Pleodorina starrii]GLC75787.1 hypothetical protein PLESTF_001687400 [Pleodorina starrii]
MDTLQLQNLHRKRQELLGRVRTLQQQTAEKANTLKDDLDSYDLAATEIMSELPIAIQLLQQLGRSTNPGDASLLKCIERLEDLRSSHSRSHSSFEQICGQLGSLIAVVVDLEEQQFKVLSEALRRLIVLSGTRGHVSDFRYQVYWDVIEHEPDVQERFPTLSSFQAAMRDEYRAFQARKIDARPLAAKFGAAVVRLGLSLPEWQRLKALAADGVQAFYHKFTLEELQSVTFPSDLEPCRPVLLKAARKVLELEAARAQAAEPNADAAKGFDFF